MALNIDESDGESEDGEGDDDEEEEDDDLSINEDCHDEIDEVFEVLISSSCIFSSENLELIQLVTVKKTSFLLLPIYFWWQKKKKLMCRPYVQWPMAISHIGSNCFKLKAEGLLEFIHKMQCTCGDDQTVSSI